MGYSRCGRRGPQASHTPVSSSCLECYRFRPNCGLGRGQLLRRVEASPYLRGPLLGLPRRKLIMVKRRETKIAELRDQKAVSRRDLVKAGAAAGLGASILAAPGKAQAHRPPADIRGD